MNARVLRAVTLYATFTGEDGSLGYRTGQRYRLRVVASSTSLGNAAVNNTVLSATGSPPGGGGGITYGGAHYDGIRFDAAPSATNRNVCRGNVVGHFTSNIRIEGPADGCVKDLNTEF